MPTGKYPHSKEHTRKVAEAHRNKPRSEETKRKLSEANRKLSEEQCKNLIWRYINSNDSVNDLLKNFKVSKTAMHHGIHYAIKIGAVTQEQYDLAKYHRRSMAHKNISLSKEHKRKLSDSKSLMTLEQRANLARDYCTFENGAPKYSNSELQIKYGIKNIYSAVKVAIKQGLITKGKYTLIANERNIFAARQSGNKHHSEETRRRMSESAIKNETGLWLIELNQNRYTLEGNNYASMGECATALALQMYIPGFKIEKGETFQVKLNGESHKVLDFVLSKIIIEYHPIDIRKHMDIGDYKAYVALKKELPNKRTELNDLMSDIRDEITLEYWYDREEAVKNSEKLRGKEVIVARNAYELYDYVISKYGDREKIPSRAEFRKQFDYMRKLAQPIPRKKDLEGKVEAA